MSQTEQALPPRGQFSSHLKLSTLSRIAFAIEKATGIQATGTTLEMWYKLVKVAGHCKTRQEAAKAIAASIYNRPFNGDYPSTEAVILERVVRL